MGYRSTHTTLGGGKMMRAKAAGALPPMPTPYGIMDRPSSSRDTIQSIVAETLGNILGRNNALTDDGGVTLSDVRPRTAARASSDGGPLAHIQAQIGMRSLRAPCSSPTGSSSAGDSQQQESPPEVGGAPADAVQPPPLQGHAVQELHLQGLPAQGCPPAGAVPLPGPPAHGPHAGAVPLPDHPVHGPPQGGAVPLPGHPAKSAPASGGIPLPPTSGLGQEEPEDVAAAFEQEMLSAAGAKAPPPTAAPKGLPKGKAKGKAKAASASAKPPPAKAPPAKVKANAKVAVFKTKAPSKAKPAAPLSGGVGG